MIIMFTRTSFLRASLLLQLLIVCLFTTVSLASLDSVNPDELTNVNRVSIIPLNGGRYKRDTGRATSNPSTTSLPSTTSSPPSLSTTKPTNVTESTTNSSETRPPQKQPTDSGAPVNQTQEEGKPVYTITKPISTLTSLGTFDARDVAYFLESHPSHSIIDPRVYFTDERTTRSLAIMLNELEKLPIKLRFSFVVRVFNELGRKIVSKLNYYSTEVSAILRKTPDDLGNKPEVSMLVDAVNNAFESKEDSDPKEDSEDDSEERITRMIYIDKEKAAVFDSSLTEISTRFAHIISHFAITATKSSIKIPDSKREIMARLLSDSMEAGTINFINEVADSDKFRIPEEIIDYTFRILNTTFAIFRRHIKDNDDKVGDSVLHSFKAVDVKSFNDLNPISDRTGLIGPWNNYLFTNLGSSERVIKLFSALLSRVPPPAKARWINMYISQVYFELERTLSGFVVMQGMPYNKNASQDSLLNPSKSVKNVPNKVPKPRSNYSADKNRIPARCYLAGRRWRLVLTRALKGFFASNDVIKGFADKVGELKIRTVTQSGNDIYRLCLPRLEAGLRGWGINGDPQADGSQSNKLPIKNPIENLETMSDPFVSGVQLGYKMGFKVGYNEERNATLEMERAGSGSGTEEDKSRTAIEYLARASYRRAATVGAKKAFEIAVREGYLATLKISIRAGMLIPSEAGSRLSSLRCTSFGGQAGMAAGRSVADSHIIDKQLPESNRTALIRIGETQGLLAGEIMGQTIGAIVGKEAAEEAYRRGIIRGGKVKRAKFHLEEYEAGANMGFDFGLKEGKRVASSSTLDPSAPRFFRMPMPVFSDTDMPDVEVDHWEKDLIPPITDKAIDQLQEARNHTSVSGSLRGVYKVAKEVKQGLKRVSYSNVTYDLEVFGNGFIMNNVAYLTLNGTVNKMGILRGSLIARDIFNDDKD